MTETVHNSSPAASAATPDAPWGIHPRDRHVLARVRREGIFGLGDTYVDGLWTTNRLDELMYKVFTTPQPRVSPLVWGRWLALGLDRRLFNRQAGSNAFNIGTRHYDLGNDLFRTMLDGSMTYTSGYWASATTLAEAQEAKLELLCRKLCLRPGMRVLDIGCGWGNFASHAATRHGARVTGITVSNEQAGEAQRRCAGLPVEIRVQDYRAVDETFDRIVSIEMIEAVGVKNIPTFYRAVERCLVDGGLFALQSINGDTYSRTSDRRLDQYLLWILKHIFPDGHIPSEVELSRAGGTPLRIEHWQSFGQDYSRTLLAWAGNFAQGWDQLKGRYGEPFRRRWEFYLAGCAAAFRAGLLNVSQIVYAKGGAHQNLRNVAAHGLQTGSRVIDDVANSSTETSMSLAKILFAAGFFVMAAAITYGFVIGDFFGEARALFPYPWFRITLTDLYTGLFLFSGWVLYRERSLAVSVIWIVLFILLGNLATFAYAFVAATKARGDWKSFWLGKHRAEA